MARRYEQISLARVLRQALNRSQEKSGPFLSRFHLRPNNYISYRQNFEKFKEIQWRHLAASF
jgi:hypothetical protein